MMLSVSRKMFNDDPTLIEFHDHHTCEGGISLSDYGYASDSDLDEEEEIDEIVTDSRLFYSFSYRITL
jgi:hypothetical protein